MIPPGNELLQWNSTVPAAQLKMTKLQETFRVLSLRSNLASVEVLRWALMSQFEQVRLNALNTLIQRGGVADMAAAVERIDDCSEAELNLLSTYVPLLMIPIEAGLGGRDPLQRQRSLVAIAKLQIAPLFHHLVEAAEAAEDPQQMVAAELLIILATKLGGIARFGNDRTNKVIREQLLVDLWQSMSRYNDHRITDIVDAWLCASHWDDKSFREAFTPACGDAIHKVVLRQLKHSRSSPSHRTRGWHPLESCAGPRNASRAEWAFRPRSFDSARIPCWRVWDYAAGHEEFDNAVFAAFVGASRFHDSRRDTTSSQTQPNETLVGLYCIP